MATAKSQPLAQTSEALAKPARKRSLISGAAFIGSELFSCLVVVGLVVAGMLS